MKTLANTINHTVPAKGGKEGTKREREREDNSSSELESQNPQ
jgi:hypothetical protein